MNLRQLDAILVLSQVLNFNRAAEKLHVTQPSLTYSIQTAEEELGFKLFMRSGKGAVLTPAGLAFTRSLTGLREDYKKAVEHAQNISSMYRDHLSIGLPFRSAIYFLPLAIEKFNHSHPEILVEPRFLPLSDYDSFLRGDTTMIFARKEDMQRVPNVKVHPLYQSHIYLITERNDPLATKNLIKPDDLIGRTLMVGGGSQPELIAVQNRVLQQLHLSHFNSNDLETTLTNVASHKGICLAPGFLNNHLNEFAWTPFDCQESISCVVCSHANDNRRIVTDFVRLLQDLYQAHPQLAT